MQTAAFGFAAVLCLALSFSCGSDNGPRVDTRIRVERFRFFPNQVDVRPGTRVRWVNVERRANDATFSVTSGTGPDDPEAGALFDRTLLGAPQGEPEGDDFIYKFDERGTFFYFSRLPEGGEFMGRVTVR